MNSLQVGLIIALLYWFLIAFKPSEPFLVDLLVSEKGFSEEQVYQEIFPMWTYSFFVSVMLSAFLAEMISYKVVIILGTIGIWLGCFLLLIPLTYTSYPNYLYITYLDQWLEGFGSSSGVIFTSYLYILVSEGYFVKITSYSRSAQLFSSIVSSLLGTVLVAAIGVVSSFFVTLVALSLAFLFSLFLKSTRGQCTSLSTLNASRKAVLNTFTNWTVVKWLLWSAFFLGLHQLVLLNVQSLWENDGGSTDLNGIFYALAYGFAAIASLIPSRFNFESLEVLLPFAFLAMPILSGSMLLFLGMTTNVYTSYVLFIMYHSLFEFMYPISSVVIALQLTESLNYATIFSIKTFLALLIQTAMQFTIGPSVLHLDIHDMFSFFSFACFMACAIAGTVLLLEFCFKQNHETKNKEGVDY